MADFLLCLHCMFITLLKPQCAIIRLSSVGKSQLFVDDLINNF